MNVIVSPLVALCQADGSAPSRGIKPGLSAGGELRTPLSGLSAGLAVRESRGRAQQSQSSVEAVEEGGRAGEREGGGVKQRKSCPERGLYPDPDPDPDPAEVVS